MLNFIDLLAVKIYRGFGIISRGFRRADEPARPMTPMEALSSDWAALCRDGEVVRNDFATAFKRVTALADEQIAVGQARQSSKLQPAR